MTISELGPNIDISIFPCHEAMESATGDDADYINRVVCLNSDKEVCYPTAITDIPVGVLIKGGAVGEYVTYRAFGVVPVKAGEVMTMPKKIGIFNDGGTIDGRVGAVVSTNHVIGMIYDTADAEDDIVTAIINCINPGILV